MNTNKFFKKILFWQPKKNYFKALSRLKFGPQILLFLNYSPWLVVLLATISLTSQKGFLIFQIFLAMILSEIVEKVIKVKNFWSRPITKNKDELPKGFIKSWYKIGSFPSGHAIKAVFFTLLLLTLKPTLFLPLIVLLLSLALIRVILSLHYPIDFLGGSVLGGLIYCLTDLVPFDTLLPWTQNIPLMLADLPLIFTWWLVIFIVSSFFLPLTLKLFSRFWDRGYLFSKAISAALATYLIFVLSVFRILPFTRPSFLLILISILGLNFYFFKNNKKELKDFKKTLKQKLPVFILQELLFFSCLALWAWVRGFGPRIEGLEKFMDWGFVNSSLRTPWLPPSDMWFAGESINYYYFGHLIAAFWTQLSTLSSAITYNLLMATSFALTFSLTFSFSSNLAFLALKKIKTTTKKINFKPVILAGLVSAFLLSLGGNLHTVYKVSKISKEQSISLQDAANRYWYPDSTRFIGYDPDIEDKTIHEFPLYSFVVADLHGHMNDIPHVIFFLAFLLTTFFHYQEKKKKPRKIFDPKDLFFIVPTGLTLSIMYMTNAWDFGIYGLFFALFTFLSQIFLTKDLKDTFQRTKLIVLRTALLGILVIFSWFVFTLPFTIHFKVIGEGLRFSDTHTPFYQLFVLYGGFWIISSLFLIFLSLKKKDKSHSKFLPTDLFVLTSIIIATILIILPEIGYIKDIYVYSHRRANSMFKLVYQAFIIYSLSAGYIIARIKEGLKTQKLIKIILTLIFSIVFSIHMLYPYFAIRGYYGRLKEYQGIYGLDFLKKQHPNSYEAVNWINKNITGQPVILEAVGDSYTLYNHVSAATGLPTIEGWLVHEWLWRGGYDQPGARAEEVRQVYEAQSEEQALPILQKYFVQYIFLGDLEREKYKNLNESLFRKIGKPIFTSGDTVIYKVN